MEEEVKVVKEKLGMENLYAVAQLLGLLGTVGVGVFEDKKITLSDLMLLPKVFPLITKIVTLDFTKISGEFADLDAEEIKYLEQAFAESLALPGAPKLEGLIESGFKAVMTLVSFIQAIKKEKENG